MKTIYISTIPNTKVLQCYSQKQNLELVSSQDFDLQNLEKQISQKQNLFIQLKTSEIKVVIDIAKSYKAKIVAICNEKNTISLKRGVHQAVLINKNCEILDVKNRLLIATTNAGKVSIYKDVCKNIGVLVCSLADIKVDQTPEENGVDEIENSKIKATFYHQQTGLPVLANDSGLYIDKLAPENQPGQFVRRHNGKELTDKQLLDCYIKMLKEIGGESSAHYNVGLCIIDQNGKCFTKLFQPKRYFISTPSKIIQKGVPLNSIAYDDISKKYMSEMTAKQKNQYEGPAMLAQQQFVEQCLKQKN